MTVPLPFYAMVSRYVQILQLIVSQFHIWFVMTVYYTMRQILLQNATTILFAKCNRSLLQNASGFLLKNATVLLQNATVITNCDDFVTKCDSNYKMQKKFWHMCFPVTFAKFLRTPIL